MAIIPCRECSHQISDQAISCPSCGAPVGHAVKARPGGTRVISRVLITLMALWTLGTLTWLLVPRGASDQLTTRAKWSLQRLDRGVARLWSSDLPRTAHRTDSAPHQAAANRPAPAVFPVSNQPVAPPRSVYRTTAEELYRDYEANVVATQAKIGASRVRLTGNVAAIDQDASGRPIVKLWTGKESTAAMTLTQGQRAAAAQLAKGEAVEIECDKLGRSGSALQGNDCTLSVVDSRPKDVNLALFLANESGATRVYVVGPMSEDACQERSAEISSRLQGSRGEHVVSRNCTEAARERIPPQGCHLNASAVRVADVPTAHLWRYDCSSSAVAHANRHRRSPAATPAIETTLAAIPPAAMEPNAQSGASAGADGSDSTPARAIPLPVAAAAAAAPAAAALPAHTAAPGDAAKAAAAPGSAAVRGATNNIRLASASNSDTGTMAAARIPSEEATVAHAAQTQATAAMASPQGQSPGATPATTATIADDLTRVRATDPRAADHIASYCGQITAAVNRDAFIADCRHNEADAWTRLVLQNEFPTMDDATRKRCSEPPFPDTYVAKETCARYLLHAR